MAARNFDRAAEQRKDLDYLEQQLDAADSVLLPIWRGQPLLDGREGSNLLLPTLSAAKDLLQDDRELVWLGRLDGRACFALDISSLQEPQGHPALRSAEVQDLRFAGARLSTLDAGLAAYARSILYWHSRSQFCGSCGETTAPRDGGHMRACPRQSCGAEYFPRTDPAIIVLVTHGDRCLLGRQARWPRGMHSTLAGFVEPGENLEEAVAREVREEAGVVVKDVRYFRSQPWPFPASLMLGFTAEAQDTHIELGDDELEDAGWFTREAIRSPQDEGFFVPGNYSLSGQLIEHFLEGEEG